MSSPPPRRPYEARVTRQLMSSPPRRPYEARVTRQLMSSPPRRPYEARVTRQLPSLTMAGGAALVSLRQLSLTMERGASATVEYSSLAKLKVLDFFCGNIDRSDMRLVNNVWSLNISDAKELYGVNQSRHGYKK